MSLINACSLRSTLEGMIVRHRAEDVEKDVELPPLHQKIVYLDGSFQDKLTLNLFSLVIVSNAVTSERQDADYLFHPRQRKELAKLVGNLRQASFFWSGTLGDDAEFAINVAKTFLHRREVYTTDDDRYLLQKVVDIGSMALSNTIWLAASKYHEMPFFVKNKFRSDGRAAWSMDSNDRNPTLIGASQLLLLQKFVHGRLIKNRGMNGLKITGKKALQAALTFSSPMPKRNYKAANVQRKLANDPQFLVGAPGVDGYPSPKGRRKKALETNGPAKDPESGRQDTSRHLISTNAGRSRSLPAAIPEPTGASRAQVQQGLVCENPHGCESISVNKTPSKIAMEKHNDTPQVSGSILSTASSKLSYLISQVVKYQQDEKIIIFYEADNVAYYIAQALEAINVEHLIYAKSLSADHRSRYLVQFNLSTRFRCLLMDLSQAAFGLDISSASRVFFVNPVLNKQVEAQAVKRAHRIGQSKPVYVETLVLNGSVEEVIVERRNAMSNDELKRCKTILDDKPIYEWIKNVRFVEMAEGDIPDPDQMAKLEVPQPIFGLAEDVDLGEDTILRDSNESFVIDFQNKMYDKGSVIRSFSGLSGRAADNADETDGESEMRPLKRTKILNSHLPLGMQMQPAICPFLTCVEDGCHHTNPPL
jgi:Helicase conserved C-terminal domain